MIGEKSKGRWIMDDTRIIEQFFDRDETALDKVSVKYHHLYMGILKSLLHDEGDAEECADDLLLALWNSIPPENPKCLGAFIATLARHIGIDRLRKNTRAKRGRGLTVALDELAECLSDEQTDRWEERDLAKALSDFCRTLDPESRVLFVRRYFYTKSIEELARRFGMSENYVSVKLYRTRKKLRKKLEKEGLV